MDFLFLMPCVLSHGDTKKAGKPRPHRHKNKTCKSKSYFYVRYYLPSTIASNFLVNANMITPQATMMIVTAP